MISEWGKGSAQSRFCEYSSKYRAVRLSDLLSSMPYNVDIMDYSNLTVNFNVDNSAEIRRASVHLNSPPAATDI